ncbi:MAG: hypothetical protein U0792_12255 [Gemmataceae bacterium]
MRAKRERPFLDTKVICAWNGEMIAGYARAGQVFENKDYIAVASTAAEFILSRMRDKDGRLFRLYAAVPGQKPIARGTAFLDDYAYLVHGLLNLHDASGDKKWLDSAKQLTDIAIKFHGDGDKELLLHRERQRKTLRESEGRLRWRATVRQLADGSQPAPPLLEDQGCGLPRTLREDTQSFHPEPSHNAQFRDHDGPVPRRVPCGRG